MGKRLYACRNCRRFTLENFCKFCNSTNLSSSWKGLVIVIKEESEIAKFLNIEEKGKFALFVG